MYPEWPFASLNKNIPTDVLDDVRRTLLELSDDSEAARAGKYVG